MVILAQKVDLRSELLGKNLLLPNEGLPQQIAKMGKNSYFSRKPHHFEATIAFADEQL